MSRHSEWSRWEFKKTFFLMATGLMHGLHTFASLKHGSCTIGYVLFNGINLN